MTLFKWSTTAATNATADDTINARENQAPSTVNDAIRAAMAAVAKFRDDLSGNLVTAGSSTAFTLTTNQVFTALTDGLYVRARMSATSGEAPTLNVDSLGAKAIATRYGVAIRSGSLRSGGIYGFTYDSTDDKWIVDGAVDVETAIGEIKAYVGTSAPGGYVRANGRTIGSASSGGTERANADCADLYSLLWSSYSNTILPIEDSAGSATTRGADAATDFAANKRLPLPDLRGRALFGLDDMGNSAASRITNAVLSDGTTNGNSGGTQTVALAEANLPAHTHGAGTLATSSSGAHTHTIGFALGSIDVAAGTDQRSADEGSHTTSSSGAHTHSITGSTASTGSTTAHSNMPPAFLTTWIIKL